MAHSRVQLAAGWTFKQQEWPEEEWLPVSQAPSQIHMDLLAHKKYYHTNKRPYENIVTNTLQNPRSIRRHQ